jgi:hypothetical protein
MPASLTDPLTRGELLDLVRFLSLLGKTDGPLAVSQARVARRWQVLQATAEASQEIRHSGLNAASNGDRFSWDPAYSKVSGELPLDVFQSIKIPYQSSTVGFARCQLDVSTAGELKLRLNSATGVKLWRDQEAIEVRDEMVLNFTPGRHTLTFAIDLDQRKQGLRYELADVTNSRAQGQFVTGN